jgi:hypothetical protein
MQGLARESERTTPLPETFERGVFFRGRVMVCKGPYNEGEGGDMRRRSEEVRWEGERQGLP